MVKWSLKLVWLWGLWSCWGEVEFIALCGCGAYGAVGVKSRLKLVWLWGLWSCCGEVEFVALCGCGAYGAVGVKWSL